jgi:hypothetical protein
MPPNGGFGGNTGIHDVHNLAWKLALVLNGCADDRLLDTYESERKPVGRFTVEQAFSRYVMRTAPWLKEAQRPEPLVEDFDIELGNLYGVPNTVHADPRTTFGMPGSRAPHVWLTRGDERLSTIDLTGRYLLLAGCDGAEWLLAARRVADRRGVPIDAYCIGRDLAVSEGAFTRAYGISESGASLIRPDGFVAWRSFDRASDAERVLEERLSESLGRLT